MRKPKVLEVKLPGPLSDFGRQNRTKVEPIDGRFKAYSVVNAKQYFRKHLNDGHSYKL